jgi:hypothetical protein
VYPGGMYAVLNTPESYERMRETKMKIHRQKIVEWMISITSDGPVVVDIKKWATEQKIGTQATRLRINTLLENGIVFITKQSFRINDKKVSIKILRRVDQQSMEFDIKKLSHLGHVKGRYDTDWKITGITGLQKRRLNAAFQYLKLFEKLFSETNQVELKHKKISGDLGISYYKLKQMIKKSVHDGIMTIEFVTLPSGKHCECLIKKEKQDVSRDFTVSKNQVDFESYAFEGEKIKPARC